MMTNEVPNGWDKVTLKQFYNLQEAVGIDYEEGLDRITAYLSALTYKPITYWTEEVSTIQLRDAIGRLKFINEERVVKPAKMFVTIAGRKFSVDLVLRDSLASTFIDLATLCKDKEKLNTKYHEVLAIFFYDTNWLGNRKSKSVQNQLEIAEFLKEHCTMDVAFSYAGFFLASYHKLLAATRSYLDKEIERARMMIYDQVDQLL